MKLIAAIPVFAAVCLVSVADAQHVTRPATNSLAARPQPPEPLPPEKQEKKPAQPPEKAKAKAPDKDNGKAMARTKAANSTEGSPASPQNLEKLLRLTPNERTKALSSLPPARREQILAKLDEYQKIPPQQRARNLDRLQRLQTLPPQKQAQVRASIKKFATLPPPRHQLMQKELNQMRNLSDSDRRALMNSEEFRSKFTPSEQQMIEDISLITPRG
jgi:hypothetical protein